ncbi:MAG: hypothetical protein HEQ39_09545 [Rhizobacter sp.]
MHTDHQCIALSDATIIHRHGGYEVTDESQTVTWPDNSQATLYRVRFHGHSDMFLRAFMQDAFTQSAGHWIIFDLRDLLPRSFAGEVKGLPARDTQGMVMYALRMEFLTGAEFAAQALKNHKTAWFSDETASDRVRRDLAELQERPRPTNRSLFISTQAIHT